MSPSNVISLYQQNKQFHPNSISVFLLHKLTVLQKCVILSAFLLSVAQRLNSGRGAPQMRFLYPTRTHAHTPGRSPPNDLTSLLQRPLPKQHKTNTRDEHPCPQPNSKPQFHNSIGRRPTP